jgi:hypothetical protein
MKVIGFLCISLGRAPSSFMTVDVANALAQVQRLVSVVKIVTVLEGILPKSSVLLCVFVDKRTQLKGYS